MRYQEIDSITKKLEACLCAAETQGIATGILCGNDRTETEFWLSQLLQDQDVDEVELEDKIALEQLFENTRRSLVGDDFSYELLLPNEEVPLSKQADALRNWCQGFLFGIGSIQPTSDWSAESREIVKDIAEFTKLDANAEGEEAETDFMEITEYLRAAVMYLRTELQGNTLAFTRTQSHHETK